MRKCRINFDVLFCLFGTCSAIILLIGVIETTDGSVTNTQSQQRSYQSQSQSQSVNSQHPFTSQSSPGIPTNTGGGYGNNKNGNPNTGGGYGNNGNPNTGGGYGNNGNPNTGGGYGNNGNPNTGGGYGNNGNPNTGGGYGNNGNPNTGGMNIKPEGDEKGIPPMSKRMRAMFGSEILDEKILKFMQPNKVGLNRTYDDLYLGENNDGYLCTRDCCKYSESRLCYYQFTVEQYAAMGSACLNCTSGVVSDCLLDQCVSADGIERMVFSINRQLPGPTIDVCKGDRIVIDVNNMMLSSELAIHWHGIQEKGTPWMDGVPGLTQCPIGAMGGLFRYDFWANPSGTHFYHAHTGRNQGDGVQGALIVRECNDPHRCRYDYELPSHTIFVSDWNHFPSDIYWPGYYLNTSLTTIKADSYLVNGRGSYSDSVTTTLTPHHRIYVKSGGYKYRMRLISGTTSNCLYKFAIESHNMTIIAMDGAPCEPQTVNSLVMGGGTRIDFILTSKSNHSTTCSYHVIVKGMQQCENTTDTQTAYLVYDKCTPVPTSSPNYRSIYNKSPYFDNVERGCHMDDVICSYELERVGEPKRGLINRDPDYEVFLSMSFVQFNYSQLFANHLTPYQSFYLPFGGGPGLMDTMNNVIGMMPWFPMLYQDDPIPEDLMCHGSCNDNSTNATGCLCINIMKFKLNSLVRLHLLDNMSSRLGGVNHPMHIHGHEWQVLYQGNYTTRTDNPNTFYLMHKSRPKSLQPTRDVIIIPPGGWATVDFIADNPGMWMMHCHFDDHLLGGMFIIFQVGEKSQFPRPPSNFPRCSAYLPEIHDLNKYTPKKKIAWLK